MTANFNAKSTKRTRREFLRVAATAALFGGEIWANGETLSVDNVAFSPEIRAAVDGGLSALAARQNADGSFGAETELFGRDPGVAGLCGVAFLASGSSPGRGPFGREIEKCVEYVLARSVDGSAAETDSSALNYLRENDLSLSDVDGLIADFRERGRKPLYGHGYSTFFLATVLGASRRPEIRERLRAAVELIVRTQNSEGGWRYEPRRVAVADLSVTTCQLSALRAARDAGVFVPPETVARALEYVESCQNSDGGFRYMRSVDGPSGFARTAAAIQALQAAGADESEAVERGFRYLERVAPSLETPTRVEYYLYGEFYAAISYWRGARNAETAERWARWARRAYPNLLARRGDDGVWRSNVSADAETAFALCALLTPREAIPYFLR